MENVGKRKTSRALSRLAVGQFAEQKKQQTKPKIAHFRLV
jgi:hypothetical protein